MSVLRCSNSRATRATDLATDHSFTKKCRRDRKQVSGGAAFARASVGGFLQPLSALPMWWFLQLLLVPL